MQSGIEVKERFLIQTELFCSYFSRMYQMENIAFLADGNSISCSIHGNIFKITIDANSNSFEDYSNYALASLLNVSEK